ncbi:MAG: copper amine oxidase N-terminal domain-containing protein [Clostridia bacterium]|nr:copper amine oxidase N-terminal domain-containing protein [Clostridia bacterium]
MKKLFFTTILIIGTLFSAISANANENITVYVDGQYLATSAPILMTVADRTIVPMRDICEALGYRVEWDGTDQSIIVSGGHNDNIRLSMRINTYSMNRLVKTNSPHQITINLDVPPMLINDKTYLPIRALSEALFFNVDWDGATSTVYINRPEYNIGATSAGVYSKLMMWGEYDAQKGFTHAGLMDLYGNVIIPYGPAPTYEEVFNRTDLMDIIKDIDYSKIDIGKDGGWSSWDYRVSVYDQQGKLVLLANYALDGTVHYIDYEVSTKKGTENYWLRENHNPNTDSTKESLYLAQYIDNNGNRISYNEDGTIKGAYSRAWERISVDEVDR